MQVVYIICSVYVTGVNSFLLFMAYKDKYQSSDSQVNYGLALINVVCLLFRLSSGMNSKHKGFVLFSKNVLPVLTL